MKKIAVILGLAVMLPASAGAQAFSTFTTPANGTSNPEFWNRTSDDNIVWRNAVCNVGAVLTNTALVPADCNNEAPPTLLPVTTSPKPNTYLNNGGAATPFYFGAGEWTISLIGRIAGANPGRPVSVFEIGTNNLLYTNPTNVKFSTNVGFYLSISAYSPLGVPYASNAASGPIQFALFSNGTNVDLTNTANGTRLNTGDTRTFYVGAEDNAGGSSDYDYNDVLFSVKTVPEPSTFAVLAIGLSGLVAAARRRREA